jgi:hypothetical protein
MRLLSSWCDRTQGLLSGADRRSPERRRFRQEHHARVRASADIGWDALFEIARCHSATASGCLGLWPEATRLVRSAFTSEHTAASWSHLLRPLADQPEVFRSLAEGSFCVALGRPRQCLVTVQTRGIDHEDVGLVTVEDVEPYLAHVPFPH